MQTRRSFILTSGGACALLAGGSVGLLGGCTPASAWNELETWVPVGLAAFDGVASIVDTVFTSVAATVDALWAAVENAVSLYQHTTDPTATVLDKVIATLDALSGGLTQALAALPISIPAAVLIAARAILALTIATLKSIQAKIEPASAARKAALVASAVPPATSTSNYIKQVNAIFAANGQAIRVR
jgi:hypothetical protein